MSVRIKTSAAIVNLLAFAALVGGTVAVPASTVAQEQRSDRDDDDQRRDRSRSWRRERSDDEDRDRRDGSSDRGSSERPSGDGPGINMTDYAKSLVKQHDKNGNMMLDGEEVKQLRGRAALSDANSDNVVTVDELVARLSGATTTSTSGGAAGSTANSTSSGGGDDKSQDRDRGSFFGFGRDRDRDSDDDRSGDESKSGMAKRVYTGTVGVGKAGEDEKNTRRTYRFTPAGERLPTGLPSWFKSRDKNGDGQVLMSEYSRSWSSRMVAEFSRYDTNDDGVITPKEVAKK